MAIPRGYKYVTYDKCDIYLCGGGLFIKEEEED